MGTRASNIIKWYEYKMTSNEEENASLEDEMLNIDANESEEGLEEEISAEGVDAALVEDIMTRFREAKQNTVDSLFMDAEAMNNTDNKELSEEEMIASICAPKQSNVDDLVKMARE